MLTLTLMTVSHKQPQWVNDAFNEYAKRLPARELKLQFKEVKPENREGKTIAHAMTLEATRLTALLQKGALIISLDERGKDLSSVELASQLKAWQEQYNHVIFVVGGADGLTDDFKSLSHSLIRLSSLTLPHGMVRVLLAEQIYRAHSINQNHPYHRA